ncbi:bacteriocin leader domain-containing protein [Spiroplasma sp. DGKH1]|uniref:bacteriocin leader domain-containing protein n=1 Tax=Spiroplasma sp. DGKH1 TaxID=3050074 RepID=UPI0034C6290C
MMQKLSSQQTILLKGGALSGAFLTGIAALVNACTNSVGNLVSSGVGAYLAIKNDARCEGSYKAPNGNALTWSDKNSAVNNSHHDLLFV